MISKLRIGTALFLFLVIFLPSGFAETPPSQITIGVIPGGHPETLRSQSLDLAAVLQKELNLSVNIYVSKNYAGLVEAIKNQKVDFAFFSSMTYVLADKDTPLKVLLKKVWESPFYYSALITGSKSKIRKVEDLRGKRVAFVDQNSSSGYLYPWAVLSKNKIDSKDLKEVKFSGNHSASVKMLEEGEVDVAAVFSDDSKGTSGAWSKFSKNPKNFKVLWVSDPIPNDPFCVRQDFYDRFPKLTHTLMFALIETLEAHKDTKRFSEVLGSKDLVPATSKQYDPVREMVKNLNLGVK